MKVKFGTNSSGDQPPAALRLEYVNVRLGADSTDPCPATLR